MSLRRVSKGQVRILDWKPALFACAVLLSAPHGKARASGLPPEELEPVVRADADRILGHWQRGQGEAIIEVTRRDGVFRGVIVWSERRPERIGTEVFRGLRYEASKRAWEGRAYSIKRKREVRIDIEIPSRERLELTAHILFFTRQVDFARVPSAEVAARGVKPGF